MLYSISLYFHKISFAIKTLALNSSKWKTSGIKRISSGMQEIAYVLPPMSAWNKGVRLREFCYIFVDDCAYAKIKTTSNGAREQHVAG